jgi:hypothetical protein
MIWSLKMSVKRFIGIFSFILLFIAFCNNIYGFNPNKFTGVDSAIVKCLDDMNKMLATKDLQKVMSVFDDGDDIMLIGSDSGEVKIGRKKVERFLKWILSQSFVFYFDMDIKSVNSSNNIGWFFGEGKMVFLGTDGKAVNSTPYRISAVMVKRGEEWKWKFFSGSIPRSE